MSGHSEIPNRGRQDRLQPDGQEKGSSSLELVPHSTSHLALLAGWNVSDKLIHTEV